MVSMFFGQYLLEQGVIDREALLAALARQRRRNRSLLELAVSQRLLTPAQREEILSLFRTSDRSLEQICIDDGYLDRDQVRSVLEAQRSGWLRIGDALVEGGHLTRKEVAAHLEVFRSRQAEMEYRIEQSFTGFAEPEIVKTFFTVACLYLGRLLGRTVKLGVVESSECGLGAGRCRYSQHFMGDRELWLAVDLDGRLAGQLARSLVGAGPALEPDAISDAVCEFVNVVGGNACTRVEALGYRLQPEPPLVSGPEPPVVPDGPSIRGVALCEEDELELRLFVFDGSSG